MNQILGENKSFLRVDARSELYRQIAKRIWNPDNLLNISDSTEQTLISGGNIG
jgi:hypothetical protein